MKPTLPAVLLLILLLLFCAGPGRALAQEKKGDLDDFTEDFGNDDSEDDDSASDDTEFFLWLIFNHIGDVASLWTGLGPYPSYPYAGNNGFMTNNNEYRSYFFNTGFSYHYVNQNLRSYQLRWETQFVGRSKLSFDLSTYQEEVFDQFSNLPRKDHLTLMGFRYGYAAYRSPQLILNIEGGYRGLYHHNRLSGPEIALDMQLFPRKPLIFETKLAAAYVGESPLYTVESSLGVMVGRLEFLGGIRVLKNKDQDLLDGFQVGLRIWY